MTKTYVLYGVADRDPNELVCQFFATWDELWDFVRDLPGRYASLKLFGVKPDDFSVFGHLVLSEGLTVKALETYADRRTNLVGGKPQDLPPMR